MKKIRVLHIAATSTGGVGLNILLLARHMKKEDYDISVAFAPGSPLDKDFIKEGIKLYPIKMNRSPYSLSNIIGFFQLLFLFKRERFDIVHTHTSVGGFLGRITAWLMNIPVVLWSIHGWAFNYPYGSNLRRRFFSAIEGFLDRFTDHYIAVSRNMKDIGVRSNITDQNKVSVIYHGIELQNYDAGNINASKRNELGLSKNIYIVGSIGRFEPQKAMDDFLKAAGIVRDEISNVKFLLVGDGPLRGQLEKLSVELGLEDDVFFTGWKENVKEYIACMDIFCMSSLWEALPFILLEAMALERPVISTDLAGIAEILENEKGGLLMPVADPEKMAAAICRLLEDHETRGKMGRHNREKMEKVFSVSNMISQYEDLYRKVLHAG